MTLSLSLLMSIYYLAAQKPVPPRRATVTRGWWRACKLPRVLCWRVICALSGRNPGPAALCFDAVWSCDMQFNWKKKKKQSREMQRAKWHCEKETQTWEAPWIHASSCQLWDMQQGTSWNLFFLMLRARFIYLAVEWALLGDVPGLLLSLVMQWARYRERHTHSLSDCI